MSDSTPFLDRFGTRQDHLVLPERYPVDPHLLDALAPMADLGEPESTERTGWMVLIQVRGFAAVLRAGSRCFEHGDQRIPVRNDAAQAVLDGRWHRQHGTARKMGGRHCRPRQRQD